MVKLHNPFRQTKQVPEEESELELDTNRIHFMSLEEGRELLDEQAREYLNMSGDEFARRFRSGEIEDYEDSDVIRVSFLLPFLEYPVNDQKEQSR